MIKPDFLVIGAMKCATSTICAFLEDHPNVYMVPKSDPNFFSDDSNWEKGAQWYERFYLGKPNQVICGEGSNNYTNSTLYPECAQRIRSFCPNVKLIFSVRHPVNRIVSAWIQKRSDSGDDVPYSLERAIEDMPPHLIDPSLYWRQIEAYRKFFPDSQIWIGFLEDLQSNPQDFFSQLCTFLEIPIIERVQRDQVNVSTGKTVPNKYYTMIRKIPGFKLGKKLVPGKIKDRLKSKLFSAKITSKPSLSEGSLQKLTDHLKDDAEKFLEHTGKPKNYWKLD